MKTTFLTIAFICCALYLAAQGSYTGTPISPLIMGQAYHYTKWTNPKNAQIQIFDALDNYTNNPSPAAWPKVTESGVKFTRLSGRQYNIGVERPIGGQEVYYVSIVDDIRKNGCEPVLTMPVLSYARV